MLDDAIIVEVGIKEFKIPYVVTAPDVYEFATPDKWIQVEESWEAVKTKVAVVGVKSESLDKIVEAIRSAFYNEFTSSSSAISMWVVEVFDDSVICSRGDDYFRVGFTEKDGVYTFATFDEWQKVERQWNDVKSNDQLVNFGSAVKMSSEGVLSGYLVRFGSENQTDTTGDFFTKETEFGLTPGMKSPVYFHHCLPLKSKAGKVIHIKEQIGEAVMSQDEEGILVEAILFNNSKYKSAMLKAVKSNALGWSSGTAPHLVIREKIGKANFIKRWSLGLDATITPMPAELRNEVVSVKSLSPESEFVIDEAEGLSEGSNADNSLPSAKTNQSQINNEVDMKPEEIQALIDGAVATALKSAGVAVKTQAEKDEEALQAKIDSAVKTALQSAPAKNGGRKMVAPAKDAKLNGTDIPVGDDAFKAFAHYCKTGDATPIHTGEAYDEWQRQKDFEMSSLKTNYPLLEGTQYQGQEAVPTEVMATIVKRRDPVSIARRAGAIVYPANSNAAVIPIEKASTQKFGIVTVDGSNTFTTQTQQPLDKLAASLYLFTYNIPVDIQLLDDSVFNIDGWMAQYVGRGLGLTENQYFLMGTGSGQPGGAIYGSTKGVDSASATALTASEIVKLFYTLPGEYRDNVAWMMKGASEGIIRSLTASTSFPFVGNSGTNGGVGNSAPAPSETLYQGSGWLVDPSSKVYNSDEVDAITASKKPVCVGNFNAGYAIIERKMLTVLRDPYSSANKGLVQMWWYARMGGGITNATAFQHILTPSA